MTDYKQLCAELVQLNDHPNTDHTQWSDAIDAARAALAEPEPEGPTQPIPVSERLPGPENFNSKGECWWLHPGDEDCGAFWTFFDGHYRVGYTHWLPANALPLPS